MRAQRRRTTRAHSCSSSSPSRSAQTISVTKASSVRAARAISVPRRRISATSLELGFFGMGIMVSNQVEGWSVGCPNQRRSLACRKSCRRRSETETSRRCARSLISSHSCVVTRTLILRSLLGTFVTVRRSNVRSALQIILSLCFVVGMVPPPGLFCPTTCPRLRAASTGNAPASRSACWHAGRSANRPSRGREGHSALCKESG